MLKITSEIVEIRKISEIHGIVHRALTENVYFKRERVPSIHRSNNVNVEVDWNVGNCSSGHYFSVIEYSNSNCSLGSLKFNHLNHFTRNLLSYQTVYKKKKGVPRFPTSFSPASKCAMEINIWTLILDNFHQWNFFKQFYKSSFLNRYFNEQSAHRLPNPRSNPLPLLQNETKQKDKKKKGERKRRKE